MMNLQQQINNHLCNMASTMNIHSSSAVAWGEIPLPERLRQELERDTNLVKRKDDK